MTNAQQILAGNPEGKRPFRGSDADEWLRI
jgi:hypothetical protein